MRKSIAILFLSLFTLSFTEAGQFLKMPVLINHLSIHKLGQDKQTLRVFLEQHYLQQHQDDGDRSQDDSLPFKTVTLNNSCVISLPSHVADINFLPRMLPRGHFIYNTAIIPTNHLHRIFHPPKEA